MARNDSAFEEGLPTSLGSIWIRRSTRPCVDENAAIQALDHLDPVLPLSAGRAERHGFEYYRHGTLSLYAALDVKTGEVHGKSRRHTSADFDIVLDNLSAYKIRAVHDFLEEHPKIQFHSRRHTLPVSSGGTLVRKDPARCHRPRRVRTAIK